MIGERSVVFAASGSMVFKQLRYTLKTEGALKCLKGTERRKIDKCSLFTRGLPQTCRELAPLDT